MEALAAVDSWQSLCHEGMEILDPKCSPAFTAECWSIFNGWKHKDRPSARTILQEMSAGRQQHTGN